MVRKKNIFGILINILCLEEANIPYVFVPSKEDLGSVIRANRTCCLLMIRSHPEYKELYDEIIEKVNKLESTTTTKSE